MRVGSAGSRRDAAGVRPRDRAPAAPRRCGRRRPHPRARAVRVRRDRLDVRDHPQPVGPRPHAGRFVRWRGRCRRGRHGRGRARQRRHGFDPHPGGLLRARRHQGRASASCRPTSATGRGSTWPRTARSRPPSPTARCCSRCWPARPDLAEPAEPGPLRIAVSVRNPLQGLPVDASWAARPRARRATRCASAGTPCARPTRRTGSGPGSAGIVRWAAGTELDARDAGRPQRSSRAAPAGTRRLGRLVLRAGLPKDKGRRPGSAARARSSPTTTCW